MVIVVKEPDERPHLEFPNMLIKKEQHFKCDWPDTLETEQSDDLFSVYLLVKPGCCISEGSDMGSGPNLVVFQKTTENICSSFLKKSCPLLTKHCYSSVQLELLLLSKQIISVYRHIASYILEVLRLIFILLTFIILMNPNFSKNTSLEALESLYIKRRATPRPETRSSFDCTNSPLSA